MRGIYINQNGQKVLMGVTGDYTGTPIGADGADTLTDTTYPATPDDVRAFVESNPLRSFNLYKVVDGVIAIRTVAELDASTFLTWQWNFSA